MKKINQFLFFIVFMTSFSSNSYAVTAFLESCDFKFLPEYGKNVYIGTYKSAYGNYFTQTFDSYCPQIINI